MSGWIPQANVLLDSDRKSPRVAQGQPKGPPPRPPHPGNKLGQPSIMAMKPEIDDRVDHGESARHRPEAHGDEPDLLARGAPPLVPRGVSAASDDSGPVSPKSDTETEEARSLTLSAPSATSSVLSPPRSKTISLSSSLGRVPSVEPNSAPPLPGLSRGQSTSAVSAMSVLSASPSSASADDDSLSQSSKAQLHSAPETTPERSRSKTYSHTRKKSFIGRRNSVVPASNVQSSPGSSRRNSNPPLSNDNHHDALLSPADSIRELQERAEKSWSSSECTFLSWEGCNAESSIDPPLILTVRGFPLECGDEGTPMPVISELSLVDESAQKPHYNDHMRLIPHFHWLFFGNGSSDPMVLSCEARSDKGKNERCFLAALRTELGDKRFVLTGSNPKKAVKVFIQKSFPKVNVKKEAVCLSMESPGYSELCNDLAAYETSNIVTTYKVGVLYWKQGQDENQAFSNCSSEAFDRFLTVLGDRIEMKGWNKFRGGLNSTDDATGKESVFTTFQNLEIMFHVSTMLPLHESDVQKLERKRHLGNDIVIVIFKEGNTPFDPTALHTQFNHVFIVVSEVPNSSPLQYFVQVVCKPDVPRYEPKLPSPPIFEASDERFRAWLLFKILNGERAAMRKAKDFRVKMKNTRRIYLKKMCDEYGAQ